MEARQNQGAKVPLRRSDERTLSLPPPLFKVRSRILRRFALSALSFRRRKKHRRWLERARACEPEPGRGGKPLQERENGRGGRKRSACRHETNLASHAVAVVVGGRCRREPLIFQRRIFFVVVPHSHASQPPRNLSLSQKKKKKKQPAPRPRSTRPTTAPPAPRRSGPAPLCGSAPSCCTPPPR